MLGYSTSNLEKHTINIIMHEHYEVLHYAYMRQSTLSPNEEFVIFDQQCSLSAQKAD